MRFLRRRRREGLAALPSRNWIRSASGGSADLERLAERLLLEARGIRREVEVILRAVAVLVLDQGVVERDRLGGDAVLRRADLVRTDRDLLEHDLVQQLLLLADLDLGL